MGGGGGGAVHQQEWAAAGQVPSAGAMQLVKLVLLHFSNARSRPTDRPTLQARLERAVALSVEV